MPTKKRIFTEEFREEAVRLALTSDQQRRSQKTGQCVKL